MELLKEQQLPFHSHGAAEGAATKEQLLVLCTHLCPLDISLPLSTQVRPVLVRAVLPSVPLSTTAVAAHARDRHLQGLQRLPACDLDCSRNDGLRALSRPLPSMQLAPSTTEVHAKEESAATLPVHDRYPHATARTCMPQRACACTSSTCVAQHKQLHAQQATACHSKHLRGTKQATAWHSKHLHGTASMCMHSQYLRGTTKAPVWHNKHFIC
eukprot:scaffold1270_cov19-Tisochrysis_lutea.AAC.2